MELKVSIALHIIGIVMWVGGLMILTRFLKIFTVAGDGTPALAAMVSRVFFGYVLAGFGVAVLTGLYQISYRGFGFYMSQGWFHGKLTLIVLLLVVTGLTFADVKKVKGGVTLSRGRVGALHGMVHLVLLGAVFLTLLGSGFIQ